MAETTTESKVEEKQKAEEVEERVNLRGKSFDIIEKRRQSWVAP